jgi:hypothetical protein
MTTIRCKLLPLLSITLLASGCGAGGRAFDYEQYAEILPLQQKIWTMNSVESDTPVAIKVSSSKAAIDFYLVNANNLEEAEDLHRKNKLNKTTDGIVVSSVGRPDPTFDTTLKAWTGYSIIVENPNQGRPVKVLVKINRR